MQPIVGWGTNRPEHDFQQSITPNKQFDVHAYVVHAHGEHVAAYVQDIAAAQCNPYVRHSRRTLAAAKSGRIGEK